MSEKKKIILITGSSNGIGRLTAETLARQGHHVYASMRAIDSKNAAKRDEFLKLAQDEKLMLKPIELDVRDQQSVEQAVADIISEAGRIDIVINNAGIMYVGVSESFSMQQVKEQFDTNFFGVERVTRAVLPHMRNERDGLFINISSLAGRVVFPFFAYYCASKWALEALTEGYRYELTPLGIESIIVEPGPFPSGLIGSIPDDLNTQIMDAYGEISQIPGTMIGNFDEMFSSPDAPNTQDVADAIAGLVARPKFQRPLRTVVGMDFGVRSLNESAAPVQEGLVQGLGLDHLAKAPADQANQVYAV